MDPTDDRIEKFFKNFLNHDFCFDLNPSIEWSKKEWDNVKIISAAKTDKTDLYDFLFCLTNQDFFNETNVYVIAVNTMYTCQFEANYEPLFDVADKSDTVKTLGCASKKMLPMLKN